MAEAKTVAYPTAGTALIELPMIEPAHYDGWLIADVITNLEKQIRQAPICNNQELELDLDYCTAREQFDWHGLTKVLSELCTQVGIEPEWTYETEALLEDLDRVRQANTEGKKYAVAS